MRDTYGSEQHRQTQAVLADMTAAIERVGQSYRDLAERQQRDYAAAMGEISRLSQATQRREQDYAARFMALAGEYGPHGRGGYRGHFAMREQARVAGLTIIASLAHSDPQQRADALAELQKAGIAPSPGASGGYLMPEEIISGIVRNVEEVGIFERNCPPIPVTQHTGAIVKRTGGLTVYYPDYEDAATPSEPDFGRGNYSLRRHAVLALVDRWMATAELAVALAEYVVQEGGYAIALAEDTNWFIGDGTSTYCRYTGLMSDADVNDYVPTDDYDAFSEIIAVSSKCLGAVLGDCPAYVTRHPQAKWFMHASIFWGFMAVRDSAGMPIANIFLGRDGPQMYLMGYPVEWTQVLPAVGGAGDGASKPMLAFGALPLAYRVFRKTNGIEVRTSEHWKFPEGQIAIAVDVLQDRVLVDGNGVCRLTTHS